MKLCLEQTTNKLLSCCTLAVSDKSSQNDIFTVSNQTVIPVKIVYHHRLHNYLELNVTDNEYMVD